MRVRESEREREKERERERETHRQICFYFFSSESMNRVRLLKANAINTRDVCT